MPLSISSMPASSTRRNRPPAISWRGSPSEHDGYDRLGMVHEARGENRQAADCYRKVIDLIREHPGGFDPGFEDMYAKLVNRLDPPAAT